MILAADGVAHDHDPQIVRRDAGPAQCHKFCNGVVFTVAAPRQRHERRGPDVELAILRQIAHRPDGKVDGAVDLAEPGAALARLGGIDDGQKLQCGRRYAAFAVALAQRELHHFVVEPALHAEPFVVQPAVRKDRGW